MTRVGSVPSCLMSNLPSLSNDALATTTCLAILRDSRIVVISASAMVMQMTHRQKHMTEMARRGVCFVSNCTAPNNG